MSCSLNRFIFVAYVMAEDNTEIVENILLIKIVYSNIHIKLWENQFITFDVRNLRYLVTFNVIVFKRIWQAIITLYNLVLFLDI